MDKQISVLEITPNSLRLLIGYQGNKKDLYVLQAYELPSFDINDPSASNKEKLLSLVNTAKSELNIDLGPLVLLLPPSSFGCVQADGATGVGSADGHLTTADYNDCSYRAKKSVNMQGFEPVYCLPYKFTIDSNPSVYEFPKDSYCNRIYIECDIHLLKSDNCYRYRELLNASDIQPVLTLVSSYCGSLLMNTCTYQGPNEYFSLEMEEGYSYFSFIKNRRIVTSKILQFSIDDVINSIGKKLEVSFDRARELYEKFALERVAEFDFETDEGISLDKLIAVIRDALDGFILNVSREIPETADSTIPLVIYGKESYRTSFEEYFARILNRQCYKYSSDVLGVKDGSFDDCLGGIIACNLDYQYIDRKIIKNKDAQLKKVMFKR